MTQSQRPVIIITGASSGIGGAVAERAARAGYNITINYNSNLAGAEKVAHKCEERGAETLIFQADVASDQSCRAMVAATEEAWGRVDVLVNNAGQTKFCPHGDLEGLQAEDFQNLYQINTIGAFQMIRAVAPLMKRSGGNIVNVASIAGVKGVGSSLAYACSKAALLAINQSMARELGPEIRVNAVCPGMVEGEWLMGGLGEELYEVVKEHYTKLAPTGLVMTDATVAENIWFFATSAPNVTGEQLILDGGATLPY
jgi:3-oxoacyl-[acyl-carrier protein] reductase